MYPYFRVGGREFSTYWTVFLCGMILMFIWNLWRGKKKGKKLLSVFLATVYIIAVSLMGAKILYYIENISVLMERGIRLNGVSFFGSVFLTPLGVLLLCRLTGEKWRNMMDFYTPSLILMLAILRVGCFFSGCCGGTAVTLAGYDIAHFPAQLTECAGDLLILAGILLYEHFWKKTGRLYLFFLVYYGCMRFLLEFVRDTPKDWMGMSHGQWFSIISVAVGGYFLYSFGKKDRKEAFHPKVRKKRR